MTNPRPERLGHLSSYFGDILPPEYSGRSRPRYLIANADACNSGFETAAGYMASEEMSYDPTRFPDMVRFVQTLDLVRPRGQHRPLSRIEYYDLTDRMRETDGYLRGLSAVLELALDRAVEVNTSDALGVLYTAGEVHAQCARLNYQTIGDMLEEVWMGSTRYRAVGQSMFNAMAAGLHAFNAPKLTVAKYARTTNDIRDLFVSSYRRLDREMGIRPYFLSTIEILDIFANEAAKLAECEKDLLTRQPITHPTPPALPEAPPSPDPTRSLYARRLGLLTGHQAWLENNALAPRFNLAPTKKQVEELGLHNLETRLKKTIYAASARQLVGMLQGFATCELDDATQQACQELFGRDIATRHKVEALDSQLRTAGEEPAVVGGPWHGALVELLRDERAWRVIAPLVREHWPDDLGDELVAKVELLVEVPASDSPSAHLGSVVLHQETQDDR